MTRVWITTTADSAQGLAEALAAHGVTSITRSLVDTAPLAFPPPDWHTVDWLWFTSKEAVKAFFPDLLAPAQWPPSVAVGPATAEALSAVGQPPAFVPSQFQADAAAQEWLQSQGENAPGCRLLWPCGTLARTGWVASMAAAGVQVTPVTVYETRPHPLSAADWQQLGWETPAQPEVIALASPSAVVALAEAAWPLTSSQIACIGPSTAEAAQRLLGRVDILPPQATMASLAEAIAQRLADTETAPVCHLPKKEPPPCP
jgi:uroporphyrinogen III methyltransferase/synthase